MVEKNPNDNPPKIKEPPAEEKEPSIKASDFGHPGNKTGPGRSKTDQDFEEGSGTDADPAHNSDVEDGAETP